jgi:predicted alpha/beta superfamily hydrolase
MVTILVSACIALSITGPQDRVSSLTGNIKQHQGFQSQVLSNVRNLTVYLPPDYEHSTSRRYPVLYMHDGQNVFDGMTSYIPNMEWRADEVAEQLIREGRIEPIIIVAIDNAQAQRANEYLPTSASPNPRSEPFGGRADLYARMLVEEIKPMIDRTYRTRPGKRDTGLVGSSFGGIVTLHLGLTRPDIFGKLGVVSPSLWWDDRLMIRRVRELPRKLDQRIWIDMGTREGYTSLVDLRNLKYALQDKGWQLGSDLGYMEDPYAQHNEAAWAKRMQPILLFLFPATR